MYKSKIVLRPLEQMTNKVSKLRFIPSAQIAAILLLAAVFFQSCETRNVEQKSTDYKINGAIIEIYTIDSCEYIGFVHNSNADKLTHKGNCKYCSARKSSK